MSSSTQESTIANADLWTRYFQNEWSRWGSSPDSAASAMAEGTAARVASFLTLVAAGPIAWLYSTKASETAVGSGEVGAITVTDDELEHAEAAAA